MDVEVTFGWARAFKIVGAIVTDPPNVEETIAGFDIDRHLINLSVDRSVRSLESAQDWVRSCEQQGGADFGRLDIWCDGFIYEGGPGQDDQLVLSALDLQVGNGQYAKVLVDVFDPSRDVCTYGDSFFDEPTMR